MPQMLLFDEEYSLNTDKSGATVPFRQCHIQFVFDNKDFNIVTDVYFK